MSKILDLAQGFEEKSKQQAEHTEQALKGAFEKHEADLRSVLNESMQKMSGDIRAHNTRMSRLLLTSWKWAGIVLIALLLLLSGGIWGLGQYIQSQIQEISDNQAMIDELARKGGKLVFSRCGGGRMCIEIDPKMVRYGDEPHTYMIPKGY